MVVISRKDLRNQEEIDQAALDLVMVPKRRRQTGERADAVPVHNRRFDTCTL